jgi:PleD family two-component response regulator
LYEPFVGIIAVTSLTLAAEVSERKRADERVQQLVVTDPLTGLANYRRLIEAIELEIKRYGRSGRPFAITWTD